MRALDKAAYFVTLVRGELAVLEVANGGLEGCAGVEGIGWVVGLWVGDGRVDGRRRTRSGEVFVRVGGFVHLVKGRIEEDITVGVGGVGSDHVEGGVARSNDGDRALDILRPILMGEISLRAQRLERLHDIWEELGAGGLEIDEEDKRLFRRGVVDAVQMVVGVGHDHGVGVLLGENVEQGVDVEAVKCPVGRETRNRVPDVQLVLEQPNVCLHADAAGLEGRV